METKLAVALYHNCIMG